MKLFILTKCVSGREKCEPTCKVFFSEEAAEKGMEEDIQESVRVCAYKHEISPSKIEPKKSQGAIVFQIYDDTYAWKIKAAELELNPGDVTYVLLHAYNGGCIAYAEARPFTNKKEVDAAMNNSFQDALEMWRLMKGKTLFKNVESLIMEDFAQIQHENDVECWSVESSPVLAAV